MPNQEPSQPSLCIQIDSLITRSGLSLYRIAKETGVSEASLSRFRRGERILSGYNLDRLAEYFDVELVSHRLTKSP